MNKTPTSLNPKYYKFTIKYGHWFLVLILAPLGLNELITSKASVSLTVGFIVFLIGVFYYFEFFIKRSHAGQLLHKARLVSIPSHHYLTVDSQRVAFENVDSVTLIDHITAKMLRCNIFAIHLNTASPALENPIIYLEAKPMISIGNPLKLSQEIMSHVQMIKETIKQP